VAELDRESMSEESILRAAFATGAEADVRTA